MTLVIVPGREPFRRGGDGELGGLVRGLKRIPKEADRTYFRVTRVKRN